MTKEDKFEQIYKILKNSESFVLACHKQGDGDGFGSVLALYSWLKKQGKKVFFFVEDESYKEFLFLPSIKEATKIEHFSNKIKESPEIAIGLDYGDLKRLTFPLEIKEGIENKKISLISIDHHQEDKQTGDVVLIDESASSTCEIIAEFFEYNKIKIDKDIALCLLTGIITDTFNFRHPTTTAKTLALASRLTGKGVLIKKINQALSKKSYDKDFQSLSIVFSQVRINKKFNFAYLSLDHETIEKYNIKRENLNGVSSILAQIPNISFSLTLTEWEPKETKGSLRSQNGIDVSKLAALFNGGGHKRASGFEALDKPENIYKKLVNNLKTGQVAKR